MEHDVLADPIDIFRDQRIFNQFGLLFNLECQLASQCDFFFLRAAEPAEKLIASAVDLALSDLGRIFLRGQGFRNRTGLVVCF